jgi:methionine sulfoxide reductase heme-binding subunit
VPPPRPRRTDGARIERRIIAAKVVLWALCLAPAGRLAWYAYSGGLGANPIEFITLDTGFWTLVLLMTTLAVTPLRRLTGWNRLIRFRRMLGLFAFFYATLHFLTYVALDLFFDFGAVAADIVKRPYITVGFTAFVLLIPLAVTSTKGAIRRLGRNWLRLHRLIYVSAALAVLHFYWKKSAKSDIGEPLIFAAILAALLLFRIAHRLWMRRASAT